MIVAFVVILISIALWSCELRENSEGH